MSLISSRAIRQPGKVNILLLADENDPLYDAQWNPHTFDNIDLIIGCGDLSAHYLERIADRFRGDVLYVPGNHDRTYIDHPPLGCICIDDTIYTWRGLRILGLGGSMLYNYGPYQYSEREMKQRIRRLWFSLHRHKGFDILVTHSPARGHYDGNDPCHTGFESFISLIRKWKPRYFFHGHVHMSYGDFPRTYTIEDTIAINAYTSCIVTLKLPDQS